METLLFTKILTKTDITYRFSFPTDCLHILPFAAGESRVEFPVKYGHNPSLFTFCCTKRSGEYAKPTIARVWSQIVRHKRLKQGDRLKWYVEHGAETMIYRVDVERSRQVMLLGVPIDTVWDAVL